MLINGRNATRRCEAERPLLREAAGQPHEPILMKTDVQDKSRTGLHAMLYHGSVYSLAIVLGKVAAVLLLPVYTRCLTTTDYGIMELLDLTCSVTSALLGLRLADSMLCHYFEAATDKARSTALSTALLGSVLIGGAVVAAGWFAAPLISRQLFASTTYAYYLRLVFLSVGLSLPQSLGYAYLR